MNKLPSWQVGHFNLKILYSFVPLRKGFFNIDFRKKYNKIFLDNWMMDQFGHDSLDILVNLLFSNFQLNSFQKRNT